MKTVKQLQLSGLLVLLTLLSACQSKPKDGQTDTYTSGVIAIAADESFQPIVQEEIDVFEGLFPLAGIVPRYVTEVDAVNLLLKDSLRLAITSRRLTPEEMNSFNSRKFFPQEIKIATDGLALITHLGNPDSLISVKDIRRILTGDAKQWKDIYPASRLGDISLVFDNKNSSTVRFAVDSICKGVPLSSQLKALKTNREVIDDVARTPDNSYKPYQAYLYYGVYPLARSIYALLNDPRSALPWGFASFLASDRGQRIILKSGLVPATQPVRVVNVKDE